MDVWSDPNLAPYMGVTAHWVAMGTDESIRGSAKRLILRSELIGFQRIPGSHTGEHLAHVLLSIVDRVNMTSKVGYTLLFWDKLLMTFQIGWITMDNASNNTKCMAVLERELSHRRIPFDKTERHVR